ncbi:hypothetical protein ACKI2N_009560 [Cupriavidus sp. 30B13]|uniref:hypothetical protein n=1 Tax=Cupriavidus sp. 30B13 TaxID=3384241 RepID=UPI003B8F055D
MAVRHFSAILLGALALAGAVVCHISSEVYGAADASRGRQPAALTTAGMDKSGPSAPPERSAVPGEHPAMDARA